MKKIIEQIMSEIINLTPPYDPIALKNIFNNRLLFDSEEVSGELKEQLNLLVTLKEQTELSFSLKVQQTNHQINRDKLANLGTQKGSLDKLIFEIQEQIQNNTQTLGTTFSLIIPALNEVLRSKNLLNAVYDGTEKRSEQRKAVDWFNQQLTLQIRQIDEPAAKLSIVQLKKAMVALVFDLNNCGVICSTDNSLDRFNTELTSLSALIQQLREVEPQLIDLQQKFAEQISAADVKKKQREISSLYTQTTEALSKIQFDIEMSPLTSEMKDRLFNELKTSLNKHQLIKDYSAKLDGLLSYVNPLSWYTYLPNKEKYRLEQREQTAIVAYLRLREQENQLQLRTLQLLKQQQALSILPDKTTQPMDPKQNTDPLIEQAKLLFSKYPLLIGTADLYTSRCASDFYLALLSNLPMVKEKLNQKSEALEKLHELVARDRQLEQLRLLYELGHEKDLYFPSEAELIKQVEQIPKQIKLKEALKQRQTLCKSYIDNTVLLESLIKQLKETEDNIKSILSQQDELASAIQVQDIALMSDEAKRIDAEITQLMDQLKANPIFVQLPESPIPISEQILQSPTASQDNPEPEFSNIEPSTPTAIPFEEASPISSPPSPKEASKPSLPLLVIPDDQPISAPSLAISECSKVERKPSVIESIASIHTHPEPLDDRAPWPVLYSISPQALEHEVVLDNPTTETQRRIDKPASPSKSTTPQEIAEAKLDLWHQPIKNLMAQQPLSMQEWYQQLYDSCLTYLHAYPHSFKPIYLLRDILFELKEQNSIRVIEAYIRLCPNPTNNLEQLLALKPDLPLVTKSIAELIVLEDAADFLPLYRQHLKLAKQYPIESALLLQAIQCLYTAKHVQNSAPNGTSFVASYISEDPRFEPLKRHRGFLRVWEAIEDLLRLIISKFTNQPEYEYSKRPCFFSTRTTTLLEKADYTALPAKL